MNIDSFLKIKTTSLWHPESPGLKVKVTRSWIGRLFKPIAFATLNECIREGIFWIDNTPTKD
jgi:hypothetical protein